MNEKKSGWALDSDNKLIHINDALRGANGYKCPICNLELIARKGEVNKHHFAHKESPEHNGESPLHFAAKHLLTEYINKEKNFDFTKIYKVKEYSSKYQTSLDQVFGLKEYELFTDIETALCEVPINEEIKPDITVTLKNDRKYFIEVYVTSKKNKKRISLLKDLGISVLEIDLSNLKYNSDHNDILDAILKHKNQTWLNISNYDFPEVEKAFKAKSNYERISKNQRVLNSMRMRTKDRESDILEKKLGDLNWLSNREQNFKERVIDTLNRNIIPPFALTNKISLVITNVDSNGFMEVSNRIWKSQLRINNKTWIDCFITDQGVDAVKQIAIFTEKPIIVLTGAMTYDAHWLNTEHWEDRAKGL